MKIQAWAAHEQAATLSPYGYEIGELGDHECIVKVLTCGICYSDVHMIDNDWQCSSYPLVPGHEVVGEVVEVGRAVPKSRVGQRVGIGWQASACLTCSLCLSGVDNLCSEKKALIVAGKGAFADHVLVDSRFAFPLPEGLDTKTTGPLLCGGTTVYSALHYAGMTSGQDVGIIGVGGLGHLAVQFASKLGNRVTVFTTSDDKAAFADRLGAHHPIVTTPGEPPPAPPRKLDVLLNTVPHQLDWAGYLEHVAVDGTFTFVATPMESAPIPLGYMLDRRQRVMASAIGSRAIITRMLSIADRFGIAPVTEQFPLDQVNEAITKLRANKVRYRAVLNVA